MDLLEIERVKRVKYRYCRAIDSCDIATLKTLFTEEAAIDYYGGSYHFAAKGREAILKALEDSFHNQKAACHSVTMPLIDILTPRTAKGQFRLLDYVIDLPDDNLVTIGAAEYVDDYVLGDDNEWRIAFSTYQRVYEQVFRQDEHNLTFFQLGGYVPGPFTYKGEDGA